MNYGVKVSTYRGMNIPQDVRVQLTKVDDLNLDDVLIAYYLPDMSCNLEVVFLVFYQMQQKNQLDISYSFRLRSLHRPSKIHLYKEMNRTKT